MLRPLKEPKRRHARFLAYDLEWFPGLMQLRMVGVKDAVRPRRYLAECQTPLDREDRRISESNRRTVAAFLDAELTEARAGYWFYAHAGGLADVQFLLEYLIDRPEYEVEAAFSGSAAMIVRVRRGKHRWTFVDSLFTLKATLKEIGKLLGPGHEKGECAFDAPVEELSDYCLNDCEVLYDGLSQFEDVLIGMGSELRPTLAACAMRLFRRKYLQDPIATNAKLNRLLRPAYVGGRVEVFYRKPLEDFEAGVTTPGYYYDVNSCYPWAMTRPMPERFFKSLDRLPGPKDGECCWFADVSVDVPEDDPVPVLPLVHGGSLYFPTGPRRAVYCGPELEAALERGARLEKVHQVWCYRPFFALARFAEDVYRQRMRSSGFHKYTYKILGNSLYGKFGERPDKCQLLVNPSADKLEEVKAAYAVSLEEFQSGHRERALRPPKAPYSRASGDGRRTGSWREDAPVTGLSLLTPGAWLVERAVKVEGAHVPIAAYVTSEARALLHRHLTSLEARGARPLYCDTDGFQLPEIGKDVHCAHDPLYCPIEQGKDCAGCLLGGVKCEKVVADAVYFAPKLYYVLEASGEELVRAKGFGGICDCLLPLGMRAEEDEDGDVRYVDGGLGYKCPKCQKGRGDKLGRAAFARIVRGEAATSVRMTRIRALFARGYSSPREDTDEKRVAGSRPKRRFSKDGTSRAWTTAELDLGAPEREAERRKR